ATAPSSRTNAEPHTTKPHILPQTHNDPARHAPGGVVAAKTLVLRGRLERGRKLGEQARTEPGGACRPPQVVALCLHGAGNIEVAPGQLVNELVQEERGEDHPSVLPTDIRKVRDVTLQLLTVAVVERHAPGVLVGRVS